MELKTSRFGVLHLDDHRLVDFVGGIPGFPQFMRAVLIEVDDNPDYYWLQSIDDGDLAFLTVVPWSFFADYELVLNDDDQSAIELDDAGDAFICCLVSVDRDSNAFTANLRAPIVVNVAANRARQVILPDERLGVRAPLL
ncbi:MAG: flagellar assembly protein FliW [Acidimicrobiales bacterium]